MNLKICVIGLGYVGLPIFLRLSKYFNVVGYDNNSKRVIDLNNGYDFNLEYVATQQKIMTYRNHIYRYRLYPCCFDTLKFKTIDY